MISKDKVFKVLFFVGIGGVSMSALAELAMREGCAVFGSDITRNQFCEKLEELGVRIFYGHSENNLKIRPDMVVFSAAIKEDNIELMAARGKGIPVVSRSHFLGEIAKNYENVIAISGMHGKTTTTAMIAEILMNFAEPTVHIGGDCEALGGNLRVGGKQYFVTEACEYADSFLGLSPTHAVITNIEKEHMDYFRSVAHIKKSFNTFASRAKVCYVSYKSESKIISCNKKTFGIGCGQLSAANLRQKQGRYSFDIIREGQRLGRIALRCSGRHNVLNALAAAFVCLDLGVPMSLISKALFDFENVKRRFECLGEVNGNVIIHDYAHHPTEIKNAINTAYETYGLSVVCIFQPHTFSRTRTLFKSFLTCFNKAKEVFVLDTYPARESYDYEGSAEKLCCALRERKQSGANQAEGSTSKSDNTINRVHGPFALEDFDVKGLADRYKNRTLLFLGAGNIELLARNLVSADCIF